jgi:phosphate transport system substrate-binding protein
VPAITALGSGEIDIALLGRPMTAEERAAYPEKKFHEFPLGSQVIVVLVSRSVWESGVRALKKEQLMNLYEGRIKSWKELGGEDRPAKFFEPAHGLGTWEIFATWLYDDMRKAPAVPWEEVPGGAEAQTAVQFQAGSASVAPYRWADKRDAFALALIEDDGTVIEPTPENVASGKYPLTRPAFIVTADRPATHKRKVVEFMESAAGQEIVANNDLLPNPPAKVPAP